MIMTLAGASECQEHPVSARPIADENLSASDSGFRAAVAQCVCVVNVSRVRQALNKAAADAVGRKLVVWPWRKRTFDKREPTFTERSPHTRERLYLAGRVEDLVER